MHAAALAPLLALMIVPLPAVQEPADPLPAPAAPAGTGSVNELIDAVYRTVSFPAGEVPDWARLRELMLPEALIVQPAERGRGVRTMGVEAFVQLFVDDIDAHGMSANGFEERVVGREVTEFGDVASALVVFEARMLSGPRTAPQRGLDCFQLVRKQGRWWIASIATQFERPDDPIPARLIEAR